MRLLPGFPSDSSVENPPAVQEPQQKSWFDPWVGKILWKRKRQPTPVFLPGKSFAQRSLTGCSPWGRRKIRHNLVTHTHTHPTSPSCQDSRHLQSTRVYSLEVLPPALEQCFSALNLCRNSRSVLLKWKPWFWGLGWSPRVCISSKCFCSQS